MILKVNNEFAILWCNFLDYVAPDYTVPQTLCNARFTSWDDNILVLMYFTFLKYKCSEVNDDKNLVNLPPGNVCRLKWHNSSRHQMPLKN